LKDEGPEFGNPASTKLMQVLQPTYWFAAHMHTKFPAVYSHSDSNKQTKFLSLSKVKAGHDFLQVLDFSDPSPEVPSDLMYDAEWMCILLSTLHMYSESAEAIQMPNIENTKGTSILLFNEIFMFRLEI
jgi:lariat debranching enzyme